MLVTLAHVSTTFDALNYFDPPKRLIWAVLALSLAVGSFRCRRSSNIGLRYALLACLAWVVARSVLRERPTSEIEVLMTWLLPGLLFGLGLGVNRERAMKPLAWGLLLGVVIQSVVMILQYVGIDPFFAATTTELEYRPGRMIGTIGYQNQAADFVALASVSFILLCRNRWLRLLASCAVLAVVALTGNRGAFMGFLVATASVEGFLALATAPNKRLGIMRIAAGMTVLLAVLAGLLLVMPTMRERLVEAISDPAQSPALASRAVMAHVATAMWADRPIVGWGAGEFALQYLDRLRNLLPVEKTHEVLRSLVFARETHNDYLQFGAEFGLAGVVLLCCLLVFALRILATSWRKDRTACASVFFVSLYMLFSGLASFPWQTAVAGPLAALLLGVLMPTHEPSSYDARGRSQSVLSWLEPVAYLVLSVALVGWQATDTYLNVHVPSALQRGNAAGMAAELPKWMHKYHAITGAALARDGLHDDALSELMVARRGYRDVLLYNNLGHVYSRRGDWSNAISVYREWTESGIDHSSALSNLSIAYEHTGEFAKAAETLEREISLWPDHDVTTVLRLATLHLRAGDAAEAHRVIEGYESRHVHDLERLPGEFDNLVGAILLALGERTTAERRFRNALKKQPDLESARRNLDQVLKNNPN